MRNHLFIILILTAAAAVFAHAQESGGSVTIRGTVTDFEGKPLPGAEVRVIKDSFAEPAYTATTNENGEYEVSVAEGVYMAIIFVKDYRTKYLEYWAWDVPALGGLEINARIDRLELYALNAFVPQGGAGNMMIYFRPMSLKRVQKFMESEEMQGAEVIDIAPDLRKEDITVTFGGREVDVLRVDRQVEVISKAQGMVGYLIQTPMPEKTDFSTGYVHIEITLHDRETGERGAASLLYQRPAWSTAR